MVYKRYQFSLLQKRLQEPRRFIQAIVGPRQIGKSTLVKQVLTSMNAPFTFETADAVEPADRTWIANLWQSIRMQMQFAHLQEYLLVIDEIHKINDWSNLVKKEWDYDCFHGINIKVVILGSSRLLLKSGLNESLAGRFELIRMTHWSYQEMSEAFGFSPEQYIYFGGYPGCASLISHENRWRRYMKDAIVDPSIRKDILQTRLIYKPALIKQLFEIGCHYASEELSLNKILGQLQDAGNVTTLASYMNTLNEAELLCGLQKYANDQARKYNSIPKLMPYNTALLTVQTGKGFEKDFTNPQRWGRWVETAIGAHLLCHAEECNYRVYYWREKDKEVDFILQRGDKVAAVEVKSGRRTTNQGLPAFCKKFSPTTAFIVGSGGIPVEEFLKASLQHIFQD